MATPRFTYDGDPSNNDRDAVRWNVGDTDGRRPMLDDREIDYQLGITPNVLLAAAYCCEALAGKFSREANVTVGGISKAMGSVAKAFKDQADTLRARACLGAAVSFPATHQSTKDTLQLNDDLPAPQMRLGIHDNPWAVQISNSLQKADFRGWW